MRCSLLLCLITFLCGYSSIAQVNYVQNGGFEQYSKCPYAWDQIKFATGWSAIDTNNHPPVDSFGSPCSAEYCNTCAVGNRYSGAPDNTCFYHYPHTGSGMAQVTMYFDDAFVIPYHRDYLQGKLIKKLSVGKPYCVTFFVALEQVSGYAINHIGAYLDNGMIDTTKNCGLPQTTHIPQVQTLDIVNDTLHWTKIEGSFTATGTEQYITIGNFYDKAHTATAPPAYGFTNNFTWYLVDDVSVVESDIPAYAGGTFFKAKKDSVFVGRNEVAPGCMWYRNGVLIDTLHAGFWVKDTVNTVYKVKQSICGNVKWDSTHVYIAATDVGSVGNESIYKLYPNPATKEIILQAPNNTSSAELAIYDMSGKVMMRQVVEFVNGEVRVPIDLAGGVYVVEILRDGVRNLQRVSVL